MYTSQTGGCTLRGRRQTPAPCARRRVEATCRDCNDCRRQPPSTGCRA